MNEVSQALNFYIRKNSQGGIDVSSSGHAVIDWYRKGGEYLGTGHMIVDEERYVRSFDKGVEDGNS